MIGQVNSAPSGGLGPQGANANSEARSAPGRFEAPVVKAETAIAVEPPQKGAEASVLAREFRRNLNPPDPNAPAGPPPSFEASILDRAMEELKAPPPPPEPNLDAVVAEAAPEFGADPTDEAVSVDAIEGPAQRDGDDEAGDAKAADPYAVPPSADLRAEREVSEIRNLEQPAEPGSVDVEL
jgi:hypothetical protein